ncbi:LADA_0F04170g1_1 [Lachancea dasiensis]|uniref:glutathione-specific gamma-glutamylcyclotransferase n=1 Tax=Lachancea dasiensis TaxID=1072105 RepID=A0A1G4JJ04_9SACH|nr:LADA_0F04170g1_1 [Lachancea dasiensis]
MTQDQGIWVLGYGSLIYKPPPHFQYRVPGIIYGYKRRFWQSSTDHRGTPKSPGRVATLIAYPHIVERPEFLGDLIRYRSKVPSMPEDLQTLVAAYYIPAKKAKETLDYLNIREQDGYIQQHVEVHLESGCKIDDPGLAEALAQIPVHSITQKPVLRTMFYIGLIENDSFIGPETVTKTAEVILNSKGMSGPNREYLFDLYNALVELAEPLDLPLETLEDSYLTELVSQVRAIAQTNT